MKRRSNKPIPIRRPSDRTRAMRDKGRKTTDGMRNLVSGVGTQKDKATQWQYIFAPLTDAQIDAMYGSDWLARKLIDIIPEDMTREWRTWQSEHADDFYAAEDEFEIPDKLQEALTLGRQYGGSAILIGDGSLAPEEPLDIDAMSVGGLKYIHVFSRLELTAGDLITELDDPSYGKPLWFEINTQQETARDMNRAQIHRSRFCFFTGARMPRSFTGMVDPCWGLSVLQAVQDAIMDAGAASRNTAAMTNEAKVDIIKIPLLDEIFADPDAEARLIERLTLANTMKSVTNQYILGGDEEYVTRQLNLSGLPDIMRVHLQVASGAADIPVTRLLGQSPAGLNATGESDLRNYYDMLRSKQRRLRTSINPLDRALKMHVRGVDDTGDVYIWDPLWQMSETDQADVSLKKAQAVQIIVGLGLFDDKRELRPSVADMLIDDATLFPTLDQHLLNEDDFEQVLLEQQQQEEEQAQQQQEQQIALTQAQAAAKASAGGPPKLRVVGGTGDFDALKDAEPRPLYVYRKVTNGAAIVRWAKQQGIVKPLAADDMHVTIMFSREPVDWFEMGTSYADKVEIKGGPRQLARLGPQQDAIVLLIPNTYELKYRHQDLKAQGCSWDWPEYQPHITIAYDSDPNNPIDLEGVEAYQGDIILGPEVFEDIDENWKAKVTGTMGQSVIPFADEFQEQKHPRGPGGKWKETGGELVKPGLHPEIQPSPLGFIPTGPESKYFVPSKTIEQHKERVQKLIAAKAQKGANYRHRVRLFAEESKHIGFGSVQNDALMKKIGESFYTEALEAKEKGKTQTYFKLLQKSKVLGFTPPTPAPEVKPNDPETKWNATPQWQKQAGLAAYHAYITSIAIGMTTEGIVEAWDGLSYIDKLSWVSAAKIKEQEAAKQAYVELKQPQPAPTPPQEVIGKTPIDPAKLSADQTKAMSTLPVAHLSTAGIPVAQTAVQMFNNAYAGKVLTSLEEVDAKVQAYKDLVNTVNNAKIETEKEKDKELAELYSSPEAKEHLAILQGIGYGVSSYLKSAAHTLKASGLQDVLTAGDVAFIQAYTGSSYKEINASLRRNAISVDKYKYVKALNQALDKLPPYKGTVWRKANLPSDVAQQYQPGQIVFERAFTSSAKNANIWSGQYVYVIEEGHSGKDIQKVSIHHNESEVLFKANTHFVVTKRDGNYIYMKEYDL